MNRETLEFLGYDTSGIPTDADIAFNWGNMPQSLGILIWLGGAALLVWFVVFLYLKELNTCPRRVALVLAAIRSVVLLILLLVVFPLPQVTYSQQRIEEPYVLLVIDDTTSFGRPDTYLEDDAIAPVVAATGDSPEKIRARRPTRAQLVEEVFAREDGKFLKELEAKGKLRVTTFYQDRNQVVETAKPDVEAEPNDGGDPKLTPAAAVAADEAGSSSDAEATPTRSVLPVKLNPTGEGTYIARAVRDALKQVAGSPVAAVVLVTDGRDTSVDDDPVAAIRTLAERGLADVPVITIGVGDSSPPRNLRVVDVAVGDDQVWEGDPFEIQATIAANGLGDTTVQAELVEQFIDGNSGAPGPETMIESQSISLRDGGQSTAVFKHSQKRVGQYVYTVRVAPQAHESDADDNSRQVRVGVFSEKARVLLIAGGPSWEYRMVTAQLTRERQFDLSAWLQSMDVDMPQEGNTRIKKLPYERKELDEYDVIVMLDPNPDGFNEKWIEDLSNYVTDGGGLLYMAGPKYGGKFLSDHRTRKIRDLLPVSLDDAGANELQQLMSRFNREWPLGIVTANLDQPIMRFGTDARANKERWDNMPGIYWSFPASGAKPAARVLIEHTDPRLRKVDGSRPLLATLNLGTGHVVYMGFNGTWRWRRVGKDAQYFDAFWVQAVRYLVQGRLTRNKRRGTIETAGNKFNLRDPVRITAKLLDPSREPLTAPTVEARLQVGRGNESLVQLKAIEGKPGEYEGSLLATQIGLNRLWIELEGDKPGETVQLTHEFNVQLSAVEARDPTLDRPKLREIAHAGGGEFLEISQLDEVAELIPDRQQLLTVTSPPIELWDFDKTKLIAPALLILLGGLLTIEWAVRKKFKLM